MADARVSYNWLDDGGHDGDDGVVAFTERDGEEDYYSEDREEFVLGASRMSCCGLVELSGIGQLTGKNALATLKASQKAIREGKAGGLIATTTANQKAAAALLKRAGYKVVDRFRNPNSGNRMTVWYKRIA